MLAVRGIPRSIFAFQPLDSLGLVTNQPLDLGALPAMQSQLVDAFPQRANDLGMSLGTLRPS